MSTPYTSPSGGLRRLLVLDADARRASLRTLNTQTLDPAFSAGVPLLWGEALCQYLIHEDPGSLVIARGPLAFLPGNKATVGYVSPITGLPHYSFVGGRGFCELLNLGLDAIVLTGAVLDARSRYPKGPLPPYAVLSGRAPDIEVSWRPADSLPPGQRSAYHALLRGELNGQGEAGSIFTVGHAAHHGFRTANLAVDGIYHAGRGGAGFIFAQFLTALVLMGTPLDLHELMGDRTADWLTLRSRDIAPRLATYCDRLSRRDGGTVAKLYSTGNGSSPTLPARNAQRVGYGLADLGARRVLRAHRIGQTGCQWCQVNCRHWHWVSVDYAPDGLDRYLDDFEPTYAVYAMLDLAPRTDSFQARLDLIDEVDRRVIVPIEQLGIDVMDAGVAVAALFEGLERGIIPPEDVPPPLRIGPYFGNLDHAALVLEELQRSDAPPALRALADGPEALAARYPMLHDIVFTGGAGTLANAGHANALWTFLMPFSRFFSHYAGQVYKIDAALTPEMSRQETGLLFERVVAEMLRREALVCLGNALSLCAFTFVIFSEDGEGRYLEKEGLLTRTLSLYGLDVRSTDLLWMAQAFWVQSMVLKRQHGWQPPSAEDLPVRIYDLLSVVLHRSATDLAALMTDLIAEWQRQAGAMLIKFGQDASWLTSA